MLVGACVLFLYCFDFVVASFPLPFPSPFALAYLWLLGRVDNNNNMMMMMVEGCKTRQNPFGIRVHFSKQELRCCHTTFSKNAMSGFLYHRTQFSHLRQKMEITIVSFVLK